MDSIKIQNKDDNKMAEYDDLNIEEFETEDDVNRCRQELKELKKERKYNAMMEKIISLFNAGHTDADLMLELAQIYYNTQDYARAATWAINAFNHDGNTEALLFLARVYSADDKMNEMAETINLVLAKPYEDFSQEQLKIIDDLLFYIELSYEADEISDKFPNAARWMNDDIPHKKNEIPNEQVYKTDNSSIAEIPSECVSEENNGISPQNEPVAELDLAEMLMKLSTGTGLSQNEITFLLEKDTAVIISLIDQLNVSLKKKALLCNFMASAYYETDEKEKTIIMLKNALKIDDQDDLILKNLGYVFYVQNEFKKAFTVLRAVNRKDFMVCELLKKCAE